MKKELLIASALVGSLGLAGVAEAASASMSGHQRVGIVGSETDSATNGSSNSSSRQSSFSVSISETTDGGIGISTGFDLAEENGGLDASGLTLTFTSGAKLDLIEAGNAATTHVASVPSGSGEMGVTAATDTNAPTTLTFADGGDNVGFEFHTAADAFGVDGLKASVSFSTNGDAANTTAAHGSAGMMSVGASYVATAGDSTVTFGAGLYQGSTTSTTSIYDTEGFVISASAVTGSLTVGVGFASGTDMAQATAAAPIDGDVDGNAIAGAEVLKAGAKYVSGDMTFSLGMTAGSGNDTSDISAAQAGSDDSFDSTNASIDYAVASGVTATLGYADISREDDGAPAADASGSAWYVGATVSF
jgi:hypothetical protein